MTSFLERDVFLVFKSSNFVLLEPYGADFVRCRMFAFAIDTFWLILAVAANMCVIAAAMANKTVGAVECTMPVLLALVAAKPVGDIRFNPQDVEACLDL